MWDGYPADRERLYALFDKASARPVVLSGDSHSFWANELHNAAGKRVACEFGTTGITSPGAGELAPGINAGDLIAKANAEVLFNDQMSKGFVLLTLNRPRRKADMVAVSTIVLEDFTTKVVKSFRAVRTARAGSRRSSEALAPLQRQPHAKAQEDPAGHPVEPADDRRPR